MPVRAVCPECGATTSLADNSPERSVECSQCGSRVAVPGARAAAGPPPVPAKAAEPAAAGGFDVVDQADDDDSTEFDETGRPIVGRRGRRDDDYDDRPRRRRGEDDDEDEDEEDEDRPRRARARDEDEDDDEDRPRRRDRDEDDEDDEDEPRRRPARARRDEDEDEDEDEDDRPRSRRRDEDDDEDEEDEDDRPRRPARARDDDEDDEEEDEDDSRSRRPARSRRDDDEDEDEGKEISEEEAKAIAAHMTLTMREMLGAAEKGRQDDEDEDEDDEPRRPRGRAADDDEDDEEDGEDDPESAAMAADLKKVDPNDKEAVKAALRKHMGRPEDWTEEEDEEDEDDAPRSRSRAGGPPKRHWPSDEDDEGEDEEEGEDEDEDEDDRPRRPTARKKSGAPVLLIVGLLAFVVVGVGGGALAYFLGAFDALLGDKTNTVARNEDDGGPPGPPPGPVQPPIQVGPVQAGPVQPPPAGPLAIRPANLEPIKDKPPIALPGKATDACAGAGGRFVFFHCAAEKKLVVFDVSALQAVKEIPTSGPNTLVAAGATRLLLADKAARAVRRWDLVKMEQDKEGPLPFDGELSALSLGAASDGPALMVGAPGPSGETVGFLNPETLGPAGVGWGARPASLPADVRVRAAANGSQWVATAPGRAQVTVLHRYGNTIRWGLTNGVTLPYAAFSDDGNTLYTPFGPTGIPPQLRKAAKPPADVWLPAVHGPFWLHSPGKDPMTADVLARDRTQSLGTVNALPEPAAGDPLTPDQHSFFVPDARVIILLAPERDHITVAPFDIPETLKKGGRSMVFIASTPPTTFTPGRAFEYAVRTYASSPNLKYTVFGPPGSTVSPDGKVRWDAPANPPGESVDFVVTASIPGAASTQKFSLYNAAAPAPKGLPPKKPDDKTKEPNPKSPEPKVPVVAASRLVNPVAGRLPIAPANMTDDHVVVDLPGQIRDVCVAGGGRHLILHIPARRKLVVFDVSTLKADRSVNLNGDDVLFAAGMEKLAVVYPDEKLVVRYSLATFKPETDATLDVRQRPTAAAMGSQTAGPLILGGIPAQGNASKMLLMFVDLDTLTEVPIARAEGEFKVTFGSAAHLRASADGRTLGAWFAQLLPSGLQLARLDGNTITGFYRAETVGHVAPGPDGQTVYTEKGLFSPKGEPLGRKDPALPAVHGGQFLTITDVPPGEQAKPPVGAKRVSVFDAGRDAPVARFDALPGFEGKHDPFERDNPLPLDKRLFLVPEAGILVVVPPTADKLHVYRLPTAKGEPKKGGG